MSNVGLSACVHSFFALSPVLKCFGCRPLRSSPHLFPPLRFLHYPMSPLLSAGLSLPPLLTYLSHLSLSLFSLSLVPAAASGGVGGLGHQLLLGSGEVQKGSQLQENADRYVHMCARSLSPSVACECLTACLNATASLFNLFLSLTVLRAISLK